MAKSAVKIYNKAVRYHEQGKISYAISAYRKAISQQPGFVEALTNLGNIFKEQGRFSEAATQYSAALKVAPTNCLIMANLGSTLIELGQYSEAQQILETAYSYESRDPHTIIALGNLARRKGDVESAKEYLEKAIAINPGLPEAFINLGGLLNQIHKFDDAYRLLQQAVEYFPDNALLLNNLANNAQELGRIDEAIDLYRRALRIAPEYGDAHWNLATALLSKGEYTEGWAEYEWRWSRSGRSGMAPRKLSGKLWQGGDVAGKTLFVYAEQGYGDTLQFIRYAQELDRQGAKVIFEAQSGLHRLLEAQDYFLKVTQQGDSLPYYDNHLPLLSAPMAMETTLQTIPADVPYILPPENLRIPLPETLEQLKVGIVWTGNPAQKRNSIRSIPVQSLLPLLQTKGVQFYSLQVGRSDEEWALLKNNSDVIDVTDKISDYADTAAIINELDLVISVCTSTAHLAGAMAKPVWIPLAHVADYRWLLERSDSPWYPTARLFRQTSSGGWESVIKTMCAELESTIKLANG